MPNITVEGPPLDDLNKKRKFVETVTTAATEAYGMPKEAIIVVIKENGPENVGLGGKLLIDRIKREGKAG